MLPGKIHFGGVATLASGLPYNYTTGATNSGDTGATTDRPVINGVVVGRNAGHGRPIYDVSPFLERAFALFNERVRVIPRIEAFNSSTTPISWATAEPTATAPRRRRFRRAPGGHHRPVAGAVAAVFVEDRVLTQLCGGRLSARLIASRRNPLS